MTTQKVGTVKISLFDKENYIMWKKKMLLFLQVANPKYLDVLKKGPKISMVIEPKVIEDNVVITKARTYTKDPKDYTPAEKEEASLDAILQLILVDSLDPLMNRHVMIVKTPNISGKLSR